MRDSRPTINATRYALRIAALGLAYFVTAKLSLVFAIPPGYASAVWPPAGLALAALWLHGPNLWPAIWLGAAAANYTIGGSAAAALAIATGNSLEALVGSFLATRYLVDRRGRFGRPPDVFGFFAIALACATVGATIGVGELHLSGTVPPGTGVANWMTWWLGDATGMMIFTPLLLAWSVPSRFAWTRPRALELALLAIALITVSGEIFFGFISGTSSRPVTFLVVPLVIWAAIRFEHRAVTTLCALLAFISIGATVAGYGPFAELPLDASLLLQQLFASTLAATGLALAAMMQELRRMHDTLRRSNEEMEEMMHLAAHDLQEPLRTVLNFSDLLERKFAHRLGDEGREFVRFLSAAAGRGRQLIQSLLEVAEARQRPLELGPVSAASALEGALANLKGLMEHTGAQVTSGPLPVVRADWRMLQSVFQNLVSNALKYRSNEPPRVSVHATRQDNAWLFQVRDNGRGIDAQYHELVFRMFERLGRDGGVEGTGAGLTLCKKIVERHGGRIWVESVPLQGSTFRFTLPIETETHGRSEL